MANTKTFTRFISAIMPQWLQKNWGNRFVGALGLMGDLVVEGARQAVRARTLQSDTPFGYLAHLGYNFAIGRLPTESETSYRAILADAWGINARRGSVKSVTENLDRLSGVIEYPATTWPITPGATFSIDENPTGTEEDFQYKLDIDVSIVPITLFDPFTFDVDAPDFDAGWCYDYKITAECIQNMKDICKEFAPIRSKLTGVAGIL